MDISTVKKFIKNTGPIHSSGFKWLLAAREIVSKTNDYTAEWNDEFRQKNIADHPIDIHKETTYRDCVQCVVKVVINTLVMVVEIYNGDNLDGQPTSLRCTFNIPIRAISPEIKKLVMHRAAYVADEMCRREDQEAYELRVTKKAEELLYS